MSLIDRYVREVGRRLPRRNRGDIKAELQSLLEDSLEERVEGDPSEEDEIALLQEFGPPQEVAASYSGEQYLVGPELYPFFRLVIGIVVLVLAIVQLVLLGVLMVFTPGYFPNAQWLSSFIDSLIGAFGIVVLVFVALQYFGVRPDADEEDEVWDPRSLPDVTDEETISVSSMITEITFNLVIIALLIFLPGILGLLFSGGGEMIINPVLQENLTLIVTVLLVEIGLSVILLRRGAWSTGTRLAKIAVDLMVLFVLYLLIDGHTVWLAERSASGFAAVFEVIPQDGPVTFEIQQMIVVWAFRLAFIIVFIITGIETLQEIYKLLKSLFFADAEPLSLVNGGNGEAGS